MKRCLSFQYRNYFRSSTRFFSKFDYDFHAKGKVRSKDAMLRKRQFKLYDGFRKRVLMKFTDEQVIQYFESKREAFLSFNLFFLIDMIKGKFI